ncbi:MAG: glycoside hydrolase family 15 protein, partial [Pyrinomonadaceae bacterium]|nr:glycoside hydrolase family 15 protein [Pyrinomonadaceae bacterium]
WYIAKAQKMVELDRARELLDWAADRALPSGVMAEQLDPDTGAPVSVSPLTWSHSTFVAAVESYREKVCELYDPDAPGGIIPPQTEPGTNS